MFRSIEITNFRGFKQLKVQGLDRISLFLGKNNVGKSALLESIFLLAAPMNAELSLRLNAFRGIDKYEGDMEEIWGWLFNDKDITKRISLDLQTETLKHRSLKMRIAERSDTRAKRKGQRTSEPSKQLETTSKSTIPKELLLEYKTELGPSGTARAFIEGGNLSFEHGKVSKFPGSVFVPSRAGYAPENARRFSKLQELMIDVETVVPPLQLLEPRLKRLSVLVTGMGPMIHADIGIGRMVPLAMMGEGTGRLLTILLAIAESKDGFVMIDEVDTGFHYSVLPAVWSAIAKAARDSNAQVFASTHSWECLRYAHESFSKSDTYDFRLHRLDRVNGDVTSTTYDQEMLETALVSGMELR